MSQTQMARRLTLGILGLNKETITNLLANKKEGEVARIAFMLGKVDGYKVAANKLDPTKSDVKFLGEFEGHNMLTGEVVVSAACYLPGGADEMIQVASDKSEGAVEFAFAISVKKSAASAVGYVFQVAAASEPRENDPLQALRERLGVSAPAPALPAPEATETKSKPKATKKEG